MKIYYYDYIKSKEWKAKKDHWIKLFGNKCICGAIGEDLHHRHYKNLGTEPPHQLILLCRKHHKEAHGLPNNFTTKKRKLKLNLRKIIRQFRRKE